MSVSQIQYISLRRLRPRSRNVRTHSKKQISQIARSIARFGWVVPLLVDPDGIIIAGHGRFEAAKTLGLQQVPALVVNGLSEPEIRALAIADNKIAAGSGWDRAALAAELEQLSDLLPECGLDLEITGFEPAEIDALMGDLIDPEADPADEAPTVEQQPISSKGDLWQLGAHRVLCGDAKNESDLHTLFGRDRATMMFTDPPYNVKIATVQGRGRIRHREFVSASGELSSEEFTRFLRESFAVAAKYSLDGAIHFICMDWRHMGEVLAAGAEAYGEQKNLVVWSKTNAGLGTFYRSAHELIFVFKVGDAAHINNFALGQHGRTRTNVWAYAGVNTFRTDRLEELSLHPTVKPVALVADAIKDCSRRGDIILDPFLGSGTTIMAAERVGRRGYGIELDPLYVDVSVRRWQAFTKRDAVLQATGQTFDEVTTARSKGKSTP